MAIPLVINGVTFNYPVDFDENWGIAATGWAQAVTSGMLQMAGGSFPLTADVNFGANFGLLSKYFETRSSNPATVGTVRLASADPGLVFRNNANSGNLVVTTDSSDNLLFNGQIVALSGSGSGGNPSFTSVTVSNSGVILKDTEGSPKTVTLTVPTTLTSTWVFKFPLSAGTTGQVLSTDGAGVTSWINAAGGGTVNSGTAGQIGYYATTGTAISAFSDVSLSSRNLTLQPAGGAALNTEIDIVTNGASTATLLMRANSLTNIVQGDSSGNFSIKDTDNARTIISYARGAGNVQIPNLADGSAAHDAVAHGQLTNVQMGTLSGQATTTNGSFTNTGLAVTITPKSSTSVIMIVAAGAASHTSAAGRIILSLARGATNLGGTFPGGLTNINLGSSGGSSPSTNEFVPVAMNYLDSPGTTSPVTYNVTFGASGVGSVYFGYSGGVSTIIAYEIIQ